MILRDPVHGLVSFETPETGIVPKLLETAEVQRLRRVHQLGLASLAYPGAVHTRFAHAVGTAHVMQLLVARLRGLHQELPYWQRLSTETARDAVAAALLHDLGHGPFSHLFEEVVPGGPRHEEWTERIVLSPETEVHQVLSQADPGMPDRVARLVRGRHSLPYLARAVSGTFDVDRCDYLLRDAHFTGVSYGRFDLDWLLRSLRFGTPLNDDHGPPLAIDGPKGLPAIESFVLARLFMFQQVYFHKTGRASEWMMGRTLDRARRALLDGDKLPATPPALHSLAASRDCPLSEYLQLDDSILWAALSAWREARDPVLADLCRRLHSRQLLKTYELYGEQATPAGRAHALQTARQLASEAGFDPEVYVGLDFAADTPYREDDEHLRVIFPDGAERRPSEVSFLLARLKDETLERVRLILPPELRTRVVEALGS
jgi:HD superfamily phosphohydrolase